MDFKGKGNGRVVKAVINAEGQFKRTGYIFIQNNNDEDGAGPAEDQH